MFEPRVLAALAAGSTVVTPNKRLARALVARYDADQRVAGRRAWPAVRALPWGAWLDSLWSDVLAWDALPSIARRLDTAAADWCWKRIVIEDGASLFDPSGAATLATDAWSLMKSWGAGGESWRGWQRDVGDDPAAFARWAERFHARLGKMDAIDTASLADSLALAAPAVAAWRDVGVVLAGFVEMSPQQERLVAALARHGASITRVDALASAPSRASHASAASPGDEVRSALAWARTAALATPGATIGIAVLDLASRTDEIRALADDVLCPALQRPGDEASPRPYNVSLGASLAQIPLVGAALDLIEWTSAPLPLARAAVLLRSPYLPEATSHWPRRAALEKSWIGGGRRELSFADVRGELSTVDPGLENRLRRASDAVPAAAAPRVWTDIWRSLLATLGWPGTRPLDSAEQQTRNAWDDLLVRFAGLAVVEDRMRFHDAVAALRGLANVTLFQPETATTPIQIVGVLEAAGLPFDRLWVAGLAGDRWPQAPEPNPLLPLSWQRAHDVPRSSAARELRFARALTASLLRGAPEVVVSFARNVDDHPRALSTLIEELRLPSYDCGPAPASYARAIHAEAPERESIADYRAPALRSGERAPGGARIVEAQGDCPFKAIGSCRLEVEPWPAAITGLTASERGILVHAALAAFWREVRDHHALARLDETQLTGQLESAIEAAWRALKPARRRALEPLVVHGEARRLSTLLRSWIERQELPRPPFAVLGIECPGELTLADVSFDVRIDRIDAIGDTLAIIDYKTGVAPSLPSWFDTRPSAPQLGLYALARRAIAAEADVHALAYAQLRPGEPKVVGVAADPVAWPALKAVAATRVADDWTTFLAWWRDHLTPLAVELRDGVAFVSPRDPDKTCRNCGLFALCRIRESVAPAEDAVDE
jgi:probable DNA repair protein